MYLLRWNSLMLNNFLLEIVDAFILKNVTFVRTDVKELFLFINSYSPEYFFIVFMKHFDVPQSDVKIKNFVTFFVSSGRFKDGRIKFSACKFIEN